MPKLITKIKNAIIPSGYRQKKFYSRLIKKNDLCFDIGANKGSKSKSFLSLGARVIAFEPQSNCLKYLSKIKNKRFSYSPVAVGPKDEMKNLNIANHIEVATFSRDFIDYFKNDTLKWNDVEKVKVKKLDTLIKIYGIPDFCKLDVEGYELDILSHLSFKIPMIEFEFTGGFITNTIKIIELLNQQNTSYNFNLNENPKFALNQWVNAKNMIKIINKLPVNRLHGNIFVKNT